ncbi:TPA: hypothetical protein DDZ86_00465 [Candidatus Dependentiae bacterium]|nr:MAG: hypothetical protein UW09_C0002G0030 [candidate division TM6 bacterium GW2011_GWF2_43_87]HBL98102.1 hypothetical protein [Candidatus Dependentiae bacterium]
MKVTQTPKQAWLMSVVLAVSTIFAANNTHSLAPQFIKGTTLFEHKKTEIKGTKDSSTLPIWLKYGIPFGMVFIETHIVENYARYAPKDASTSKLLNELFNVNTPDFRIPDPNKRFAGNYLTPKDMGKIIRLIFESRSVAPPLESVKEEKKKSAKKVVEKPKKELLEEKLRILKADIKKRLKDQKSTIKSSSFNSSFKNFTESLVGSLEECNYWKSTKAPLYPPHTTLYLLYGFIYKKTENRADLEKFFTALCTKPAEPEKKQPEQQKLAPITPSAIDLLTQANPSLGKNWVDDEFDLKTLSKYSLDPTKLKVFKRLDFEEILAAGITQNWAASGMAPIFQYGVVTSKIYPTISFPDCFESNFRTIFNMIAFDRKTSLLSAETLKANAPGTLQELLQFYTKHPGKKQADNKSIAPFTASDLQDKDLSAAWIDEVIKNNIPYATYIELFDNNGTLIKQAQLPLGPFFICLPDNSSLLKGKTVNDKGFYENAVTIGGKEYNAFTPSSGLIGYELAPYTHTFIFIINHLLGLNLFKNENIEEELVKPDFEKTYTQKLSTVAPFANISLKTAGTMDTHTITTTSQQKFVLNLDKGYHTFISPILAPKDTDQKKNLLDILSKNNALSPEILLILTHAFDLNSTQITRLDSIDQSFLFQGNWFLNSGKIEAIKNLAQAAEKDSKNREFYFTVIKNIYAKFYFVEGDWTDYAFLIQAIEPYLQSNEPLKKLIFNYAQEKIKDLENWQDNDSRWQTIMQNFLENSSLILVVTDLLETGNSQTIKRFFEIAKPFNHISSWKGPEGFNTLVKLISKDWTKEEMKKVTTKTYANNTILTLASANNHPNVMHAILNFIDNLDDANLTNTLLNHKNENGDNPLESTLILKHPTVTLELLHYINNLKNTELKKKLLTEGNKDVIRLAITTKNPKVIDAILNSLDHLNDINLKKNRLAKVYYNNNILMHATGIGTLEIVKIILNALGSCNDQALIKTILTQTNYQGYSALLFGAESAHGIRDQNLATSILRFMEKWIKDKETAKKILTQTTTRGDNAFTLLITSGYLEDMKTLLKFMKNYLGIEEQKIMLSAKVEGKDAFALAKMVNASQEMVELITHAMKNVGLIK